MAISSYKVFLMHGNAKLVDIKDFPDMGDDPELLDTTTLTDKMRTYIMGIQETGALSFTANYTAADYQTLAALEGSEEQYALWLGGTESAGNVTPTGSDGKFSFSGFLSVRLLGAGVNEVVNMGITIAPSTIITFTVAAG